MTLINIDLKQAGELFSISNTPMFLLRRLRSESVVQKAREIASPHEIVAALKIALLIEPKSLAEAARPYVYLLALFQEIDDKYLKEAAGFVAPYADWYKYFVEACLQMRQPTKIEELYFPRELRATEIENKSDIPVSSQTLIFEKS